MPGVTRGVEKNPGISKPQDNMHDVQIAVHDAQISQIEHEGHQDSDFDEKPSFYGEEEAPQQEVMEEKAIETPEDTDDGVHPCCILNGPRIDEEEILKVSNWLCYLCCCCGVGTLKETNHPAYLVTKCICCQQSCEMKEFETREEGACGSVATCCFCTPIFQLPPPDGIPRCMVCSASFCGIKRTEHEAEKQQTHAGAPQEGTSTHSDPYTLYEHVVYEHTMPCYCYCAGLACQPFFQTVLDSYFKCMCCRYTASCVSPIEEDDGVVCCRHVLNAGLLVAHCRWPGYSTFNPVCACCGKRFKQGFHKAGNFA